MDGIDTKRDSSTGATAWQAGRGGPQVIPTDRWDQELLSEVHPPDWVNPVPASRYNLVVIGGGTAGLVTAAGAAGLGAKVALVERNLLGGDCLNVGCIPSKCVIRASRTARELAGASEMGFDIDGRVEIDFGRAMERMRRLRASIGHHDGAARFRSLGIDVFLGEARFKSSDTVVVGDSALRFTKAVIATGARASDPDVPGLKDCGFLTNETVFTLTERPRRLAVLGGGPIGAELAQAFQRLGCEVVLLHHGGHLLDREDPDAAEIVQAQFVKEGMRLVLDASIVKAQRSASGRILTFTQAGGAQQGLEVDVILAAAGRKPNVEGLGLEAVGVEFDARLGVRVDDGLRTTNPRIFAAGDACMAWKFTHAADAAARIVIQNALFFGRKRLSDLVMPWATYTDPEVAHVGMYGEEATRAGIAVQTFTRHFREVDRAIADGEPEGFVKVHVRKGSDEILGATIVARHAGEMINELTLAMTAKIGLSKIASTIHPYPTQGEAIKQIGDMYNRTRLTPVVRDLFATFLRWMR